jgi:hypothetical protein
LKGTSKWRLVYHFTDLRRPLVLNNFIAGHIARIKKVADFKKQSFLISGIS